MCEIWVFENVTVTNYDRYKKWRLQNVMAMKLEKFEIWILENVTVTNCDRYKMWLWKKQMFSCFVKMIRLKM